MTNSRCNKSENSSSSESYTSDSNKCEEKQNNQQTQTCNKNKEKHNPIPSVTHKCDKMEKLEKTIKYSDYKNGKKIERINGKINKVINKVIDYETTVKRLRKEKHLMVNGSDAYGMFYSYCPQLIEPNNNMRFEKKSHVLNLRWDECNQCIKIKRDGIYVVNLTCQFEQPGQICLFVNANPELSSLTSTNNPQNFITVHQILNLNKGDCLSVKNYLSPYPLTTSISSAGIIPESKNICLNIWKIAPEHKKCAFPPRQNKSAWCYFDSDSSDSDSSSSDSDSDSSDSDSSTSSKSTHKSKSSNCEFEESSELSESCFKNPGKYSGK